jgi:hypothetical protein
MMKNTLFIVLVATAIFLGSPTPCASAQEEAESSPPAVPEGWEVIKAEIPSGNPGDRHFEYSLRCTETQQHFVLSCLYCSLCEMEYASNIGFDESSLAFDWLEAGKVLLARWGTCWQGQYACTAQTFLVLARDGAHWRLVLRHSLPWYRRDGALIRCDFKFDAAQDILALLHV